MNVLLQKIYTDILIYQKNTVELRKTVDDEIQLLIEPYKSELNNNEIEELKNLLASISFTAEQVAFEIGVKFALKMILSSLLD